MLVGLIRSQDRPSQQVSKRDKMEYLTIYVIAAVSDVKNMILK